MKPVQPADIISAAPRKFPSWVAWLAVVVVLSAALAKSVFVAVHYRDEVLTLQRGHLPRLSARPSPAKTRPRPLTLLSETSTLPSSRPLTVQVTAFTARSSAGSARVIVTARVSGGRPHSRYELTGGECAGEAADWTWAAGFTGARGSADLNGRVVKVSARDEYYLVLSAPGLGQSHPGPALHGYFGIAHGLSAVHDGFPPCAPNL
jgi:hypothetical protein